MMNLRTLIRGVRASTALCSRRGDEADAPRIFHRRSQRGIALVITLILLAVITTLAIAFLALTQRETGAVDAMSRTTDAEMAADSALERAKAEILAVYPVRNTNVSANGPHAMGPDMFVSVCCHDFRLGANPNEGVTVRYNREDPTARGGFIYDAAPPVIVNTNRAGVPVSATDPLDDRFFVDLNRNAKFEETGTVTNTLDIVGNGPAGFEIERDASGNPVLSWRIGDPQWIGVLRNPRRPHDTNNPFIARYAFMVLPAGRSLDVNWMHNQVIAGRPVGRDAYFRNEGVGGWENNLAAFLADLNPQVWNSPINRPYSFSTNNLISGISGEGLAFDDARRFLEFRFDGSIPVAADRYVLGAVVPNADFLNDQIDNYGNGLSETGLAEDNDNPGNSWPGALGRRHFFSPHELYSASLGREFTNALKGIVVPQPNFRGDSSNRYTFYRMLSQLTTDGTSDSDVEERGKINLNYVNVGGTNASEMIQWPPQLFFISAVTNMLRREFPASGFVTGDPLNPLRIPVFTNSSRYWTNSANQLAPLYSARIHQLLQIAANLFDASRGPDSGEALPYYPGVYRPVFEREADGGIYIVNYEHLDPLTGPAAHKTAHWSNTNILKWIDPDLVPLNTPINSDQGVFGVPFIVGVRKGIPCFNEFAMRTDAVAIRRLKIGLTPGTTNVVGITNEFQLHVTNRFTLEVLNPYAMTYPRQLRLTVFNSLTNNFGDGTNPITPILQTPAFLFVTNFTSWPSNSQFILPAQFQRVYSLETTNLAQSLTGQRYPWELQARNRLMVMLSEGDRIIDMVSLVASNGVFDIGAALESELPVNDTSFRYLWTNAVAVGGPTWWPGLPNGIRFQLDISRTPVAPGSLTEQYWRNYALPAVPSRDSAILNFRETLRTNSPSGTVVVPFVAVRKLSQTHYWQANDPLVHYTINDMGGYSTNDFNNGNPLFAVAGSNPNYAPWNWVGASPDERNVVYRDPSIETPQDWSFSTNKYANVGWMGRVHRGTPWQTIYLKDKLPADAAWNRHSGPRRNVGEARSIQPQNDWRLMDWFTTDIHPNVARGRLSVNQTNLAAWSAVLSGIRARTVKRDTMAVPELFSTDAIINPESVSAEHEVSNIVFSVNQARTNFFNGQFTSVGQILRAPGLSTESPFLIGQAAQVATFNAPLPGPEANGAVITDQDYEKIPQQILGLLKVGEPRFVIYAWGQSLKPARAGVQYKKDRNGLDVIDLEQPLAGPSINIGPPNDRFVNNYQITGEMATKAVVRVVFPERLASGDIDYQRPKMFVESFNVIDVE